MDFAKGTASLFLGPVYRGMAFRAVTVWYAKKFIQQRTDKKIMNEFFPIPKDVPHGKTRRVFSPMVMRVRLRKIMRD